jgi:nucleoside-diphosphate-sugar epimerase
MKNVIVTGATGFVGSHLSKKLVELGYNVHIISRPSSSYENLESVKNKINVFEYNQNITELINFFKEVKADVVFHLASLFISEHKSDEIDGLINSNIKFGTHILEAMSKSDAYRLINTSTSWQHYKNDEYNPVNLYAATKQAFEDIIEYYVRTLKFKVITLKLFDTYAEDDNRGKLINLLGKFSKEKKELKMSPGEQKIDLVHVDDVVSAFISAYDLIKEDEINHNKYAVSSGRQIQLKDLIELYEEVTGNEVLVEWGGRPYRKREVMELWRDFDKLPNWEAEISLEEGLKRLGIHGN